MKTNTLYMTLLAFAGSTFAGYLSYVKLATGSCALGQTCPFVLGYPACLYGFALFVTMLVLSLLGWTGSLRLRTAIRGVRVVSIVGLLFSVWLIVGEASTGTLIGGSLGVSSCVYGFVMYAALLQISHRSLKS